jgi:type I restriction enzyme S subunit
VGGSTPSTKEPIYWQEGTIPWATPKDLASLSSPVLLKTERSITEAGLQQISSGLLPKGTVLLSSRAPIGYLAIAEMPVAINQGFIAIICNERISNHYVLQWLKQNMSIILGRANGTTFLEICKANFRPIPILLPPSNVLKQFNCTVEGLYQALVNNLAQNHTLSTLRDALLPKLISGQIRVKEAEKIAEVQL